MYLEGKTPRSMPRLGISFETEAQQAIFFKDVEPDVEFKSHGVSFVMKVEGHAKICDVREAVHTFN